MKINYIKHQISNLISISKIVTIHYYEFDKNFCFEGEAHNFWEMVYVDKGEVLIKAGEREFCLSQGEVAFHKPNEFHTISANGVKAPNVFVISFVATSKTMDFFKNRSMKVPSALKMHISTIVNESEKTFNLIPITGNQLEVKENAPYGGQQMIKTHLEQFLIMLVRTEQNAENPRLFPTKESLEHHLVGEIIDLLENKINENITIKDICSELHYSKTYLSRIFKESTSHTILEYATKLKIDAAKEMIRENNYNFSQISEKLAFDNPQYFSRVFKRVTKMSPSEYKKSIMNMQTT